MGASFLLKEKENKLRIDNMVGKERAKYDALVARGYGSVVSVSYLDVVENEAQVLVSPAVPAVPGIPASDEGPGTPGTEAQEAVYRTDTTPTIVTNSRDYYVGTATLGTLGKFIQVASIAFANGASTKAAFGIEHNIPFVEEFTKAGVLGEMLGAILQESDYQWLSDNADLTATINAVVAFAEHNDFFGMIQKVMEAVNRLNGSQSGAPKLALSEETARNALLGSLAGKG